MHTHQQISSHAQVTTKLTCEEGKAIGVRSYITAQLCRGALNLNLLEENQAVVGSSVSDHFLIIQVLGTQMLVCMFACMPLPWHHCPSLNPDSPLLCDMIAMPPTSEKC